MPRLRPLIVLALCAFCGLAAAGGKPAALAAAPPPLTVRVAGVSRAGFLPLSAAFCMPAAYGTRPLDRNPGVAWSPGPPGTRSYALIMTDPNVPRQRSLINKPGTVIPADAPRTVMYHWVLADIPAAVTGIAAGEDSSRFTPRGKPAEPAPVGRRGQNGHARLFAQDPARRGPWAGYDGPCPPLNDARIHDYRFQVFAVDLARLPLPEPFDGPDLLAALRGHVLAAGMARASFAFGRSR